MAPDLSFCLEYGDVGGLAGSEKESTKLRIQIQTQLFPRAK